MIVPDVQGGSGEFTVLFVEDDRSISGVMGDALTQRGFRVIIADNGLAALRILEHVHVDVLFADIVMPGLDGIQLVKRAKLMRPGIHAILATGYLSKSEEAKPVAKLLFKPLRADEIETEIRTMLKAG